MKMLDPEKKKKELPPIDGDFYDIYHTLTPEQRESGLVSYNNASIICRVWGVYILRLRMMTLSARPIPARMDRREVPPELMKGKVSPVTGSIFKFIPIDTTVWKKMMAATP